MVVDVVMQEYRFNYVAPLASGRVIFDIRNAGAEVHEMVLAPLPADGPAVKPLPNSGIGRVLKPMALISPKPPGERGTFAVDLEPGRYAVLCLVADSGGQSHARRGMQSEFTIR